VRGTNDAILRILARCQHQTSPSKALFAEHGLIDTDRILRELRENGGR